MNKRNPGYGTTYLGKQFVDWLQDELDEGALGRGVRLFGGELPGLAVVVNVAPQPLGELIGVDGATVGLGVEAGKRLQGEADGELGAGEKKMYSQTHFFLY